MNAKERRKCLDLIDSLRQLILLDERRQQHRNQDTPPPAHQSPEHMRAMQEKANANRIQRRKEKLWAELAELEGDASAANGEVK